MIKVYAKLKNHWKNYNSLEKLFYLAACSMKLISTIASLVFWLINDMLFFLIVIASEIFPAERCWTKIPKFSINSSGIKPSRNAPNTSGNFSSDFWIALCWTDVLFGLSLNLWIKEASELASGWTDAGTSSIVASFFNFGASWVDSWTLLFWAGKTGGGKLTIGTFGGTLITGEAGGGGATVCVFDEIGIFTGLAGWNGGGWLMLGGATGGGAITFISCVFALFWELNVGMLTVGGGTIVGLLTVGGGAIVGLLTVGGGIIVGMLTVGGGIIVGLLTVGGGAIVGLLTVGGDVTTGLLLTVGSGNIVGLLTVGGGDIVGLLTVGGGDIEGLLMFDVGTYWLFWNCEFGVGTNGDWGCCGFCIIDGCGMYGDWVGTKYDWFWLGCVGNFCG